MWRLSAPPRQLPPGRGQAARRDVVAADPADALRTLRQDARRVSVVLGAVPADEHAVSGADGPAVGFGESLRRLLEEAGRSLRTLKRWTKRWRWRALEAVPWLASLSVTANPQSGLPLDSAGEALPESRRVVAEELRWLNALEALWAKERADGELWGWAWANVRLGGRHWWY